MTQDDAKLSSIPAKIRLLEERRRLHEALSWQATVIFFAAEAALLAVAVDGDRSRSARLLVAAIGVVVSVALLHLWARARYSELLYGRIVNLALQTHERRLRDEAFPKGGRYWWNWTPGVEWFVTKLLTRWVLGSIMILAIVGNVVLFVAFLRGWSPAEPRSP